MIIINCNITLLINRQSTAVLILTTYHKGQNS